MTGLSGAWRRVGFHAFHNEGLWRGFMLTHRVSYNPHQHIAKNFIALIHSLESPTAEVPFAKIPISDADVRLAQRQFSHEELVPIRAQVALCVAPFDPSQYRLVLINPNASELLPQRRWAKERYAQLIQALLEAHPDILILITGAPNERAEAEQLRLSCQHSRVINFAGSVTFAQLPALYTISCLMVTNDSGPGHFSAITPLKTFVLFGPETPALYGSLGNSTPIWAGLSCAPCVSASNHRKTPCQQPACMDAIRVDQVKTLVSAYLTETTATE
jgi:ADP-heptose:LPS heptosyltransferase